jgi:hypothetical protein
MAILVKLQDVVDAMELPEEWQAFLDPETGEIASFSGEQLWMAEDPDLDLDELADWEQEAVAHIRRLLDSEHVLALPDRFDVHEWDIMRRFAYTVDEPQARDILNAIHGTGAFRMFRHTIDRLGIRDDWFRYRNDTLEQIAKDWLDDHGIRYTTHDESAPA